MFIYKITHTPSGRYYIGKTKRSLRQRLMSHFNQPTNKYMKNLLGKYPKSDFIIEAIEETNCSIELVKLEQKHLDIHYGQKLCLNMLDKSDEGWEKAIAKCHKEWRIANPERVKEIALTNGSIEAMNKWRRENPEEHRKLTSEGAKKAWNKIAKEDRVCRNRQAQVDKLPNIDMYSIDGTYINTFDSIRAIVKEHPDLHRSQISRVLKSKAKQHKGYIFKYKQ